MLDHFAGAAAAQGGGDAVAARPERRTYYSGDELRDQPNGCDRPLLPVEFLNTLTVAGLPPHKLTLQIGAPVIVIRNLHNRIANGTRCIVCGLGDRVIKLRVAVGPNQGYEFLMSRLKCYPPDDGSTPVPFVRWQFPLRLACVMTINKAQGQTLKSVGLYLPKPVFSHGQLYVALSHVGDDEAVHVLVERDTFLPPATAVLDGIYTKNVVFREVFL